MGGGEGNFWRGTFLSEFWEEGVFWVSFLVEFFGCVFWGVFFGEGVFLGGRGRGEGLGVGVFGGGGGVFGECFSGWVLESVFWWCFRGVWWQVSAST